MPMNTCINEIKVICQIKNASLSASHFIICLSFTLLSKREVKKNINMKLYAKKCLVRLLQNPYKLMYMYV